MNGKGENGGVFLEDLGRTIPLVDVTVHDQHPPDMPLGLHRPGGHGRVVEDAKALAIVRAGVVGAPGQVDAQTARYRGPAGSDRAAHRPTRPFHEAWRPGKADPADLLDTQQAFLDAPDVFG